MKRLASMAAVLLLGVGISGCGSTGGGTTQPSASDAAGADASEVTSDQPDPDGQEVEDTDNPEGLPTFTSLANLRDICVYEDLTRIQTEVLGMEPASERTRSEYLEVDEYSSCDGLVAQDFARDGNGAAASLVMMAGDMELTDPELRGLGVQGTCSARSETRDGYSYIAFCEQLPEPNIGGVPVGVKSAIFQIETPAGPGQVALRVGVGSEGLPSGEFSPDFPSEELIVSALDQAVRGATTAAERSRPEVALEVQGGDEALELGLMLQEAGFADECSGDVSNWIETGSGWVRSIGTLCSRDDGGTQYTVYGVPHEADVVEAMPAGPCRGSDFEGVLSVGRVWVNVDNLENYDYIWAELDDAGLDVLEQC